MIPLSPVSLLDQLQLFTLHHQLLFSPHQPVLFAQQPAEHKKHESAGEPTMRLSGLFVFATILRPSGL